MLKLYRNVDNWKREQSIGQEENWRNLETLETRLSRTSSGGDSAAELNLLRRLSGSESNWRIKETYPEPLNWRTNLAREQSRVGETGWQTADGLEGWKSSNVGRLAEASSSWRATNAISVNIIV